MIGAVLHDIGKTRHPLELDEPGHKHEVAGYEILASYDFPEKIAQICITHAQWDNAESIEALIVAFADKLWKGKRTQELEDRIIQYVVDARKEDFWSAYSSLQQCFDNIADDAPKRLASSQ